MSDHRQGLWMELMEEEPGIALEPGVVTHLLAVADREPMYRDQVVESMLTALNVRASNDDVSELEHLVELVKIHPDVTNRVIRRVLSIAENTEIHPKSRRDAFLYATAMIVQSGMTLTNTQNMVDTYVDGLSPPPLDTNQGAAWGLTPLLVTLEDERPVIQEALAERFVADLKELVDIETDAIQDHFIASSEHAESVEESYIKRHVRNNIASVESMTKQLIIEALAVYYAVTEAEPPTIPAHPLAECNHAQAVANVTATIVDKQGLPCDETEIIDQTVQQNPSITSHGIAEEIIEGLHDMRDSETGSLSDAAEVCLRYVSTGKNPDKRDADSQPGKSQSDASEDVDSEPEGLFLMSEDNDGLWSEDDKERLKQHCKLRSYL